MVPDDASLSADTLHVLRVVDAISFPTAIAATPVILIAIGSAMTWIVGLETGAALNSHSVDAMCHLPR